MTRRQPPTTLPLALRAARERERLRRQDRTSAIGWLCVLAAAAVLWWALQGMPGSGILGR